LVVKYEHTEAVHAGVNSGHLFIRKRAC
jgi:hypothetical protein